MSAVLIVGAQWGDEGKGKIVDLYTERADMVVRYAGGPNAGHTLVVGDDKLIVRLLPSGILRPQARCVMAQGMVIDPFVLRDEIDAIEARGISTAGRLAVASRAHLILSYHRTIDELREDGATDARKIGTTKKGIGPAYEDKVARRGLRFGDLADLGRARDKIGAALEAWAPVARSLGGELPTLESVVTELAPLAERLHSLSADTSLLVAEAVARGDRILLEGAQGTLLDIDHGTYPFVTSSSAVAGGACTGVGIGPTRIRRVIGITKGYCTRVGAGPFPTELDDAHGEHLRVVGGEFGSVTGRPRRTGWLDLPALRYAARVNGLDGLAVTKLDVMTGLSSIKVCVAYETPAGRTTELPVDDLGEAKPVYETLAGWTEKLPAARTLRELPAAALAYVRFVEEAAGVPVFVVSVGPRRAETIVLSDAFEG